MAVRFVETKLQGAFVVELEPRPDERGFFARTYCDDEFARAGLHTRWPQGNLSRNTRAGTLRGMHWQAEPHGEVKLVRCTRGAVWDVIVDLRTGSPTRFQWVGVELDEAGGRALYIPEGFAHGFITLRDDTDVVYQMGSVYVVGAARGAPWNDPRFGIAWPREPAVMSDKDRTWPPVDPGALGAIDV